MEVVNLWNILAAAAECPSENGIVFYGEGNPVRHTERHYSYKQLFKEARQKSLLVGKLLMFVHAPVYDREEADRRKNRVVVLFFDNHIDNIVWFWAVIAAGCIPCIATPFKGNQEDRHSYICYLRDLLDDPLMITTDELFPLFPPGKEQNLRLHTIEQLQFPQHNELQDYVTPDFTFPGAMSSQGEIAVIMLTSGSTGHPKAVGLKHRQILKSLQGKVIMHKTTPDDVFMSWTDFSHVANIIEIHLHAVVLFAKQVQVAPEDIMAKPLKFLELIHKFRVSYTFAPNFALTFLLKSLEIIKPKGLAEDWAPNSHMTLPEVLDALSMNTPTTARPQSINDMPIIVEDDITSDYRTDHRFNLKSLRVLISGGESNVVDTCDKLTQVLQIYGAPASFIRPGFGMTETCAGCVYSLNCPAYDKKKELQFATLGQPICTAKLRIVNEQGRAVRDHSVGALQLCGPVVFSGYYRDEKATQASFTQNGWFQTGDLAYIDSHGQLNIVGRLNDTILVNGVNHHPNAIEAALEQAGIIGMKPTFTAVFPYRAYGAATEALVVVYVPTYGVRDIGAKNDTVMSISRKIVEIVGVRPHRIIPLPERLLEKSALGKLSRSAIRAAFENGEYKEYLIRVQQMCQVVADPTIKPPKTEIEAIVVSIFERLFIGTDIGIEANIFDLGVSSIDLLKLRVDLQEALSITFPFTILLSYATIKELAAAIQEIRTDHVAEYDPIVLLQPLGSNTPLFFIHPGMGDVLIFLNLARLITDRPIFGLRARGFEPNTTFFKSMSEIVSTYHAAIKRVQPTGPYALVGYSFGAYISFELAKLFRATGDEVIFLATLDQPPNKKRVKPYDWYECVLSVGFFLGLCTEEYAYASLERLRTFPHEDVLRHILKVAPEERVKDLRMTAQKLDTWANLALGLKVATEGYEVQGKVPKMDIFWTEPLTSAGGGAGVLAKSKAEWREGFIGKWDGYVWEAKYHFCAGGHRTLIKPPFLAGFHKKFMKILRERGL